MFGIFVFNKVIAYRKEFKSNIITKIINTINPEWDYFPTESISQEEYKASGLFSIKEKRYKGDDLIKGIIDSTPFSCSEVHTQYEQRHHDKTKWITIFKDLFFHADFGKELEGSTYIISNNNRGHQNKKTKEKN